MNERDLVKQCLRENPEAQRELYELYAKSMLGLCYRYTKSITDAEDVLQEGFVRVFGNLKQFRFEGDLGGWIRRIMVNTALNYLKRNKKYRDEMFFSEAPLHPVTNDNPELLLEAKEIADLVQQLPPGYQAIFNLHAVEGYSHVEIGKMLGISDGTSRSQYARARALLVSWIEKFSSEIKLENYGGK